MAHTLKTIQEASDYAKRELEKNVQKRELIALMSVLFEEAFKVSKIDLMISPSIEFSAAQESRLKEIIERLKQNEPLAYILGEWKFYEMLFKVNESTLIPRPETEELVALILSENNQGNVFDIGTGTGCIPIALKNNNSAFNVSACDVSEEALKMAEINAKENKVDVRFFEMNILKESKIKQGVKYDIIVSNPPYIPFEEKKLMSENVLDYEPSLALFVDDDEPLLFYNAISDFALLNLNFGGKLYFEINENYGSEVVEMLMLKGFSTAQIVEDLNGKDRIVKAILGTQNLN